MKSDDEPTLHRYREEAMSTHFELLVTHEEKTFADGLSHVCFRELERLEDLLSRFRDGSDIVRINQLEEGETILISEEAYACVRQALEIQIATHSRFDIAVGGYMDLIQSKVALSDFELDKEWDHVKQTKAHGKLTIHHDRAAITCDRPGLKLDLGGIGKGFAIQQLAKLLDEMGVDNYLISAGGSTVLAKGFSIAGESWKVNFDADSGSFESILQNESISASGFSVKGAHLIKDDRQICLSSEQAKRVWVKAAHSSLTDALSTACLLMNDDEIIELASSLNLNVEVWKETELGISQIV